MNKVISLQLLRITISVLILLGFLFSIGCGSESKPEQSKLPKIDVMNSGDLQPTIRLNPVTDETRQLYQRYCTQCHGEEKQKAARRFDMQSQSIEDIREQELCKQIFDLKKHAPRNA